MSTEHREPTTTSFALLGLLAIKSWTTYELAEQMDRGLGKFWSRARSNVYAEPKRLVAMGLAKASKERIGLRPRTVYSITPAGRRALRAWLRHTGNPPALEWDQMVKVFFADAGSKEDLLATLRAIADWSERERRHHQGRAQSTLDREAPFPDRWPIHSLVGGFLSDFAALVGEWAHRSIEMVDRWPDDVTKAEPDWETFERIARQGSNRRTAREPARELRSDA